MTAIPRTIPTWRPRPLAGLRAIVRGRTDEAAWVRPAFVGVLALAAVLYIWNLTISGYANTYYSAAALAASQSWSAWFFGSFDANNFITVDKPPLRRWLMGLSVRLFGLSSWSILLPEALAGVATVGVLFVAVRRSFGPAGGDHRRPRHGPDAGRGPDLPLQQPRRAADAAARRPARGRCSGPSRTAGCRWIALAAALRRVRLPHEVPPGLPGPARLRARLRCSAANTSVAPADRRARGRALATVLVTSGWWVAIVELHPGRQPAVHRRQHDRLVARPDLRLRRARPDLRRQRPGGRRGGGGGGLQRRRPACSASSTTRCSARSPGSSRSRSSPGRRAVPAPPRRANRPRPRRLPAVGQLARRHGLVFSFMSGIIHSYYAVALAPADRRARRRRRRRAVAAPRADHRWRRCGARRSVRRHGRVRAGHCSIARPSFVAGVGLGRRRRSPRWRPSRLLLASMPASARTMGRRPASPRRSALLRRRCSRRRRTRSTTVGTAYGGGDPHPGPGDGSSGFGGGGPAGGFRDRRAGRASAGSPPAAHRRTRCRGAPRGHAASGLAGRLGGPGWAPRPDSALVSYLVANRGHRDLDRGGELGPGGRADRARDGPAGHGDGRLHRLRPGADARPAEDLHRLGQAPLRPGRDGSGGGGGRTRRRRTGPRGSRAPARSSTTAVRHQHALRLRRSVMTEPGPPVHRRSATGVASQRLPNAIDGGPVSQPSPGHPDDRNIHRVC